MLALFQIKENVMAKNENNRLDDELLDQVTGGGLKVSAIDDGGNVTETRVLCPICGKSFSESEIEEHQKHCRVTYVG